MMQRSQRLVTARFGRSLPRCLTLGRVALRCVASLRQSRASSDGSMRKGSGLRVSELVAVNLSDFKRVDTLLIRGKGKKERMVPVTECTQAAITAWLPIREQLLMDFKLQTDA